MKNQTSTDYEGEYNYSVYMMGYASPLPTTDEDDIVAKLHAVVKEVTGKDVEVKAKPRIGFLP